MSDEISVLTSAEGEFAMADEDLCRAVGEDLTHFYPGHLWRVGVCHEAGTVVIDLPYEKPHGLRNMGFMLYISTVLGSDGRKKVMRAGGEMLERFGLERGALTADSVSQAKEHGLDAGNAIWKSKA